MWSRTARCGCASQTWASCRHPCCRYALRQPHFSILALAITSVPAACKHAAQPCVSLGSIQANSLRARAHVPQNRVLPTISSLTSDRSVQIYPNHASPINLLMIARGGVAAAVLRHRASLLQFNDLIVGLSMFVVSMYLCSYVSRSSRVWHLATHQTRSCTGMLTWVWILTHGSPLWDPTVQVRGHALHLVCSSCCLLAFLFASLFLLLTCMLRGVGARAAVFAFLLLLGSAVRLGVV